MLIFIEPYHYTQMPYKLWKKDLHLYERANYLFIIQLP